MKHGHPRVWRPYQRYFVERDLWKGDAEWCTVLYYLHFPGHSKQKLVSSHFP
jgi:hypothetical protein